MPICPTINAPRQLLPLMLSQTSALSLNRQLPWSCRLTDSAMLVMSTFLHSHIRHATSCSQKGQQLAQQAQSTMLSPIIVCAENTTVTVEQLQPTGQATPSSCSQDESDRSQLSYPSDSGLTGVLLHCIPRRKLLLCPNTFGKPGATERTASGVACWSCCCVTG